ncbi:M15 family peptidase, partial [Achromobacter ruhlandii]|nr:M15 family peptidase [Achromobacter ruhlandii]
MGGSAQVVRSGFGRAGSTFSLYRWQIAAGLAVVLLPSLFAFVMRHNHTFIYEDRMAGPDPRIQALCTGGVPVPHQPL